MVELGDGFIMLFYFNICLKFSTIKEKYMIGYISIWTWCFPLLSFSFCVFSSCVHLQTMYLFMLLSRNCCFFFFSEKHSVFQNIELNSFPFFLFWILEILEQKCMSCHVHIFFHSIDRAKVMMRWSFCVLSQVFHEWGF